MKKVYAWLVTKRKAHRIPEMTKIIIDDKVLQKPRPAGMYQIEYFNDRGYYDDHFKEGTEVLFGEVDDDWEWK